MERRTIRLIDIPFRDHGHLPGWMVRYMVSEWEKVPYKRAEDAKPMWTVSASFNTHVLHQTLAVSFIRYEKGYQVPMFPLIKFNK